jgi:hypothetical protein
MLDDLVELTRILIIFLVIGVGLSEVLVCLACLIMSKSVDGFYNVVDCVVYWFVIVYSVYIFHIV